MCVRRWEQETFERGRKKEKKTKIAVPNTRNKRNFQNKMREKKQNKQYNTEISVAKASEKKKSRK